MERGRLRVVISLFISVVAIFLFSLKGKADWVYGVYLNATNETVTIDSEVSVFNSTANATGIFVENDTTAALNLTINTTVNATFYNETIPGVAAGVYFNGTMEEDEQVRPLGNLTITSSGSINATAIGNDSFAGGVVFGNGTSETNVTNQGSISVFSNATEGYAEAFGIAGLRFSPDSLNIGVYNNTGSIHVVAVTTQGNASASGVMNMIEFEIDKSYSTNFSSSVGSIVNSGNVTVINIGGALGEALGFETSVIVESNGTFKGNLTASLGNFTNTGNVTIYSNSQNTIATGLGVYVDYNGKGADSANATITASLDNFYNYGYFGVISNSTGGNATATGVRVGFIYRGGNLTGSVNATIGSFKNAGDFVVLAQGNNAKAYGVRVGIDNINMQNISLISTEAGIASFENTGNFSVSANATNGNATAYGIYANKIGNFTNDAGTFSVSANATNGNATAYGIYTENMKSFANEADTFTVRAFGVRANATGVYTSGNVTSFSNKGTFSVSAVGTNYAEAYGVRANDIGNFSNAGTFSVSAYGKQSSIANGVRADSVTELVNSGIFELDVRGNTSNVRGVSTALIGNFTNRGTFLVIATGNSTNATGVYTENVDNFTNSGSYSINSKANMSQAWAYGVYTEKIGNFTNIGIINVEAYGNNKTEAYGVGVLSYKPQSVNGETYINTGNFTVKAVSNNTSFAGGIMNVVEFKSTGILNKEIASSVGKIINNGTLIVESSGKYMSEAVGYESSIIIENSGHNFNGNFTANIGSYSNLANSLVYAEGNGKVMANGLSVFVEYNGTNNITAKSKVKAGLGNFSNSAIFLVTSNSTQGDADAEGVLVGFIYKGGNFTEPVEISLDQFINNGSFGVSASGRNANAYGLNVGLKIRTENFLDSKSNISSNLTTFTNLGNFIISSEATNGNASARGVAVFEVVNFNNSGNFIVNARGAELAYVLGLDTAEIGNFTNTGKFNIAAQGINANSTGINADNNKSFTFTNKGNFMVISNGSNNSTAYGINARTVMNFINENNFIVNATGSNVMAYGVNVSNVLEKFTNTGSMRIYATMSDSSGSIDAIGVRFNGTSDANNPTRFINNGTIEVKAYAPSGTNTNNINLAGIRVSGGHVEISNYGEIKLESSISGVKARTLYIEAGNVTLKDMFAITFGMPGINPDMRPIYVGSGATLNLNNAILIARIDSRNLRYNTPYYLIQNNGTVIGVWGGLERGYTNPNIIVRWGDPNDLGENSSVIFEYSAGTSPVNALASVIAGTVGTNIVVGSLITGFQYNSPMFRLMLTEDRDKPIMLASAGLSEVGLLNPRQKSYMYLIPVYTKVRASDLGFNADSYGFALGLGGRFSDRFGAEVFGGYVYNDVDFSVKAADSEKQKVFMGGINALYRIKPWFVRVSALGYTGKHDYRGYAGLNFELIEKADYNSRGYKVDLTGGYVLGGAKVRVIPQLGLRYSYTKVDSYWTKVEGNEHLNRRIKPDSLNVWKVVGGVDLDAEIERRSHWNMRFMGGVFIEEALGKNEVSAVIAVGSPQVGQKVKMNLADTTLSLNAGLSINYKRNWNFEVSGRGDFNGDYSAYTGRVMLRYNF